MATVALTAEITIGNVRYSHTYGIPARSWAVADEHMREVFREGAREGLAQHLAETLPVTITVTEPETGEQPAALTPICRNPARCDEGPRQ